MPVHDEGAPSVKYANTNGALRKEIRDDIAAVIPALSNVMTTGNSLYASTSFHLDSNFLNNRWKVEIQYKRGSGGLGHQTVAVVLVEPNAQSIADFRTAVWGALTSGNIKRVS